MAADTDTTTTPTSEAPAPAAPAANGTANGTPKPPLNARSLLGQGIRAHVAQAAGLFPQTPAQDAAALAPQPGNGVVSGQQPGATPTATAAPPEPTPQESAPVPPAREAPPADAAGTPGAPDTATPTDAAATPPDRAEAPPPAQATPAPPDQPAPKTPAAKPERAELPPEFRTQEYLDRYAADPLLRREVLSILGQPGETDTAKALKIAKRVDASDKRAAAARAQQERITQLRRSGNLQEWAKQQELAEAQEAYRQQWAQGVTQLLARTLGADPNDEGFANAGAIQPGESEELRAVRFAEWAVANSPVGKAHLAAVTAALQAEHEAQIAALRAEHEEALKSQRSRLEQEAAAQAAAALAQGRGTTAFPGRAPTTPVDGTERGLSAIPTTIRDVRGLLGAGLRLRQEATRPAAN